MPIPVADLLTRASTLLLDDKHVRWTVAELLLWMNDAASEIVIRRPAAGNTVKPITLVEGPIQTLPEGAVQLVDVIRNVPGRPISRVSRRLLDDQEPDWYTDRPVPKIRHYAIEEMNTKNFYVYPPAQAGAVVEAMYSTAPALVTKETDVLAMDRAYIGPLISYMLYRALAKDSEYANGQVAITHFQAFTEAVGTQNAVTSAVTAAAGSQ